MELGVAGIDVGNELCGCRGTGVVEPVAREHGKGRAMVLRAVPWPAAVSSRARSEDGAGGRERRGRARGKQQELTVNSKASSERSGKPGR